MLDTSAGGGAISAIDVSEFGQLSTLDGHYQSERPRRRRKRLKDEAEGNQLMKVQFAVAMAAATCVGLAACGNGQPKGQVVAKVGKEEVTAIDLQSAMNGFQAPNAQVRKAAEQQVLSQIVQRKILAQAARKQKLDKTPEFARQEQQAIEALLVRDWQEKLVKSVPAPNPDEINNFITQHPDLYSARKR